MADVYRREMMDKWPDSTEGLISFTKDGVKWTRKDFSSDVAKFVYEAMQDEPPDWAKDPWNGDCVCSCGDCGAWMSVVRPGKVQCDVCPHLEAATDD